MLELTSASFASTPERATCSGVQDRGAVGVVGGVRRQRGDHDLEADRGRVLAAVRGAAVVLGRHGDSGGAEGVPAAGVKVSVPSGATDRRTGDVEVLGMVGRRA